MSKILSERRKADRLVMIQRVDQLAKSYGLETEIIGSDHPDAFQGPRVEMIYVNAPHGLTATIDFDGGSCQPDVHVVPWHPSWKRGESDYRLARHFARGQVNTCHFRKATTIADGFDDLIDQLTGCFDAIKNGSAFQPQQERVA